MSYLPLREEERDRANEYLAGMAARGFVPMPMEDLIRSVAPTNPLNWPQPVVHPLDLGSVVIGMVEQPDGSIRIVP